MISLLSLALGISSSSAVRFVAQTEPVRYAVDYGPAGASTIRVKIVLPMPIDRPGFFVMPRAIPMGYGVQPYDRFVDHLEARGPDGSSVDVTDIDGPRWRIAASARSPVGEISYRIDLERMERQILSGGDASRVRPRFLGLLGYSVFGFVEGWGDRPIQLTVRVPDDWPVMTTLAPETLVQGTSSVSASNFYALADAQIMAGPALVVRRVGSSVPLAVSVYAEGAVELDTLVAFSDRALRAASAYFGESPFPHFTTSFEILEPISPEHGYRFSMEHLESATFRFATGQVDLSSTGRTRFYYNLLHHIVHAWIPKRCAPPGYYPFDWDFAAPIDAIWFSEGWAQYLAADILAGEGPDAATLRRAMANRRFGEASADSEPPLAGRTTDFLSRISSNQYSDDFRISEAVFSRGARMAEAIDQAIRARTGGSKTIRDVARDLMSWCARSATPVTPAVLVASVRRATGVPARALIDRWLAPRGRSVEYRPRP